MGKYKDIVNQPINLGNTSFDFTENFRYKMKYHYDFNYQFRDRLLSIGEALDNEFITEKRELNNLIQTITSQKDNIIGDLDDFRNTKTSEIENFKISKEQQIGIKIEELDAFKTEKQNEIETFKIEKENSLNNKIEEFNTFKNQQEENISNKTKELDDKIEEVKVLLRKNEATDTELGFITLNKIRDLANQAETGSTIINKIKQVEEYKSQLEIINDIPSATDTVEGKVNKNTIKQLAGEKIQEFGIGRNDTTNLNLDSKLKSGIYTTTHSSKINGRTTTVINVQYDDDWGVQLGLTEEDEPKAFIRAKRNGRWTSWREIGSIKFNWTRAFEKNISSASTTTQMGMLPSNFNEVLIIFKMKSATTNISENTPFVVLFKKEDFKNIPMEITVQAMFGVTLRVKIENNRVYLAKSNSTGMDMEVYYR